ncbi:polyadenylate-binding protein-interacting protein 12-like isoform X1 [Telopea speciosissima]|uniref:polyadenylate-binding protein-interacting protein 12-like isoform X1 n=1 Tax=Telopea speciosissima TaxID=54955 RepID=UPI001CC6D931|nr:polyadenylate-binding protein-interacting protein 12-like isoform X1 [Telopea speciosissima]XP_043716494.1 polyadenylate-binding protein-interacting protein 12-like isoform X1 [Telopea speciosissima]XP_043716496.1 polyadenylate-binding protein-interacting protein 12-like isoform X1 [Telopea speciosissima]
MAVVENAGIDLGINVSTSSRDFEAGTIDLHPLNDVEALKQNHLGVRMADPNMQQNHQTFRPHDQTFHMKVQQFHHHQQQRTSTSPAHVGNHKPHVQHNLDQGPKNGVQNLLVSAMTTQHGAAGKSAFGHTHQRSNGVDLQRNGEASEGFKRDMRDLEELLSKLNPMAEEFVPPSLTNHGSLGGSLYTNNFFMHIHGNGNANGNTNRRKKNNYNQGKRRMNNRTSLAQREDVIRRTVYVSDIDQQVTEEQLAALFINCGQVVDCRVCGDPNSVLRFAFIEFTDEEGARAALSLAGTMLGYYPVRVLPSKTAIAPVNPTFLPRSEDEREMCARTIYCTNIDKKVSQAEVKLFFETVCGEVYRLRLLGDYHHSTRIAFVEFVLAESAIAALNCSGVVLGSLPIRVSPSKTPVRPRAPRPPMH